MFSGTFRRISAEKVLVDSGGMVREIKVGISALPGKNGEVVLSEWGGDKSNITKTFPWKHPLEG